MNDTGFGAGAAVVLLALLAYHWPRIVHAVTFFVVLQRERHEMWVADLERRRVADALGFPRVLR